MNWARLQLYTEFPLTICCPGTCPTGLLWSVAPKEVLQIQKGCGWCETKTSRRRLGSGLSVGSWSWLPLIGLVFPPGCLSPIFSHQNTSFPSYWEPCTSQIQPAWTHLSANAMGSDSATLWHFCNISGLAQGTCTGLSSPFGWAWFFTNSNTAFSLSLAHIFCYSCVGTPWEGQC